MKLAPFFVKKTDCKERNHVRQTPVVPVPRSCDPWPEDAGMDEMQAGWRKSVRNWLVAAERTLLELISRGEMRVAEGEIPAFGADRPGRAARRNLSGGGEDVGGSCQIAGRHDCLQRGPARPRQRMRLRPWERCPGDGLDTETTPANVPVAYGHSFLWMETAFRILRNPKTDH